METLHDEFALIVPSLRDLQALSCLNHHFIEKTNRYWATIEELEDDQWVTQPLLNRLVGLKKLRVEPRNRTQPLTSLSHILPRRVKNIYIQFIVSISQNWTDPSWEGYVRNTRRNVFIPNVMSSQMKTNIAAGIVIHSFFVVKKGVVVGNCPAQNYVRCTPIMQEFVNKFIHLFEARGNFFSVSAKLASLRTVKLRLCSPFLIQAEPVMCCL